MPCSVACTCAAEAVPVSELLQTLTAVLYHVGAAVAADFDSSCSIMRRCCECGCACD